MKTALQIIILHNYLSKLLSALLRKVKTVLEKQTSKRLQLLTITSLNKTIKMRHHSLTINLLLLNRLRPQRTNLLLFLRSIRRTHGIFLCRGFSSVHLFYPLPSPGLTGKTRKYI